MKTLNKYIKRIKISYNKPIENIENIKLKKNIQMS